MLQVRQWQGCCSSSRDSFISPRPSPYPQCHPPSIFYLHAVACHNIKCSIPRDCFSIRQQYNLKITKWEFLLWTLPLFIYGHSDFSLIAVVKGFVISFCQCCWFPFTFCHQLWQSWGKLNDIMPLKELKVRSRGQMSSGICAYIT